MKRRNALARRRNPSALTIARQDPLGRYVVPMFATAAGTTVGILAAKPLGKSTMASGLTGAALGLLAYIVVDQIDQRR